MQRKSAWVLCGAFWFVAPDQVSAQCIDYRHAPRVAAELDVSLGDCRVRGNLAYATTRASEFRILDLSDPSFPMTLGGIGIPGGAGMSALSGSLAYVLTGEPGLVVVDVADPAQPRIIGQLAFPFHGWFLAADEGRACVTAGDSGLWVVDVSDPIAPVLAGHVDTPGIAHGVAIRGGLAYVTDATTYPSSTEAALHIVDLSNTASPSIVGTLTDYLDSAFDVDLREPYAYVSDRVGLRIVNIANSSAPFTVGQHPIGAVDLELDGPHAYAAWGGYPEPSGGFAVLDMANPVSPLVTSTMADFWTGRLGGANGVVVACGNGPGNGLVIDARKHRSPEPLARVTTRASGKTLTKVSSYAYLCEWDTGLEIFEVTTPTSMTSVGFIDTPAFAGDVEVIGSLAYVADTYSGEPSALLVVDVSTPSAPILAHRTDTPGEAYAVDVSGTYAYIADGANGLVIADLSPPQSPFLRGSAQIGIQQMFDVAVRDPYAYLAAGNLGLVVVDVSDPDAPAILANRPAAFFAEALAVEGAYAYLTGSGLEIMDISDPRAPVSVASLELPAAHAIALHGTLAYLLSYSTLYVVDVTNPEVPRLLGRTSHEGSSGGVAVFSDHVYVTSWSGISVFPPHCDLPSHTLEQPPALSVCPHLVVESPARGAMSIEFTAAQPGAVQLLVYDARGRFVRELFHAPVGPERQRLFWDGNDQHGTRVANGMYFVQMLNTGLRRVQRGIVVR